MTGEELLQREIDDTYDLLIRAKTHEGRQAAFAHMRALCERLTAEKLLRLQRESVQA